MCTMECQSSINTWEVICDMVEIGGVFMWHSPNTEINITQSRMESKFDLTKTQNRMIVRVVRGKGLRIYCSND